jgi:hypothetical protein
VSSMLRVSSTSRSSLCSTKGFIRTSPVSEMLPEPQPFARGNDNLDLHFVVFSSAPQMI